MLRIPGRPADPQRRPPVVGLAVGELPVDVIDLLPPLGLTDRSVEREPHAAFSQDHIAPAVADSPAPGAIALGDVGIDPGPAPAIAEQHGDDVARCDGRTRRWRAGRHATRRGRAGWRYGESVHVREVAEVGPIRQLNAACGHRSSDWHASGWACPRTRLKRHNCRGCDIASTHVYKPRELQRFRGAGGLLTIPCAPVPTSRESSSRRAARDSAVRWPSKRCPQTGFRYTSVTQNAGNRPKSSGHSVSDTLGPSTPVLAADIPSSRRPRARLSEWRACARTAYTCITDHGDCRLRGGPDWPGWGQPSRPRGRRRHHRVPPAAPSKSRIERRHRRGVGAPYSGLKSHAARCHGRGRLGLGKAWNGSKPRRPSH